VDEELIGREDEQAQLQAWVTEALAGRGSLVLLGGEAGVGKTTLVQHSLATSELQVLEGFAVEGDTSPFGPVVEALRSYLRTGGAPLLEGPLASHLGCAAPRTRHAGRCC
jgi:predicted ATPase